MDDFSPNDNNYCYYIILFNDNFRSEKNNKLLKAHETLKKDTLEIRSELKTCKSENKMLLEDVGLLKGQITAMKDENQQTNRELIREKKLRESLEKEAASNLERWNIRISEITTKYQMDVTNKDNLIEALQKEIERLTNLLGAIPKPPTGSKFKMYVDLKSENKKLEKELRKTKDEKKKVLVGGGDGGRVRRPSFENREGLTREESSSADGGSSFGGGGIGGNGRNPFDKSGRKMPEEVGVYR